MATGICRTCGNDVRLTLTGKISAHPVRWGNPGELVSRCDGSWHAPKRQATATPESTR